MRLIDAEKLHYKKVLIYDPVTMHTRPAVVVFAKELNKMGEHVDVMTDAVCSDCASCKEVGGSFRCVRHDEFVCAIDYCSKFTPKD